MFRQVAGHNWRVTASHHPPWATTYHPATVGGQSSRQPAVADQATANRPAVLQFMATSSRRPLIRARSAAGDHQLPPVPVHVPLCCTFPAPSFLLLATNFCTCGQLFLIGSSTCPPCPDFS
jgi:hypothetical protein